jgi:hypothetical protein
LEPEYFIIGSNLYNTNPEPSSGTSLSHVACVLIAVGFCSLFVWLVADGWCWFVLREKYCWLVAGGWFVLREKYCWLVADKPSEQGADWTIREWTHHLSF